MAKYIGISDDKLQCQLYFATFKCGVHFCDHRSEESHACQHVDRGEHKTNPLLLLHCQGHDEFSLCIEYTDVVFTHIHSITAVICDAKTSFQLFSQPLFYLQELSLWSEDLDTIVVRTSYLLNISTATNSNIIMIKHKLASFSSFSAKATVKVRLILCSEWLCITSRLISLGRCGSLIDCSPTGEHGSLVVFWG